MTSEKAEGPAADRTPRAATTTNEPAAYPDHGTYMRQLDWRIRWLGVHEHWWARTLRWHRERFGLDCDCRSCRRWAA